MNGIAGQRLEEVPNPTKTVLLAEVPAFPPYSWHQPKRPYSKANALFPDAKDMSCFVDGHISYNKMYFNGKKLAWDYNPILDFRPHAASAAPLPCAPSACCFFLPRTANLTYF
jgi:hypothetical protein